MSEKINKQKSAQYMRTLCRLARALVIIPSYDYLHNCFYKLYSIFILFIIIIGNGLSVWGRCKDAYQEFPSSTLIFTDVAVNISITITNVCTVLVPYFWKPKDFKFFYEIFNKADNYILRNESLKVKQCRTFYTELIVGHVAMIVICMYDAYVWTTTLGFKIFRNYIFRDFQNYHMFITVMLMYHYALLMHHKFEMINSALRTVTNLPESEGSSIDSQLVKMKKSDCHLAVRQISQLYELHSRQINLFNKIFGWQILFMTFSTMMGLLNSIDVVMVYTFIGQNDNIGNLFGYSLIILSSLWAIWQVLLGIGIAVACTKVSNEAHATTDICFSMLLMLDISPESAQDTALRNELVLLSELSIHRNPQFSAAGFFAVDYSLVLAIFGSVTSYVIVLIQFNK